MIKELGPAVSADYFGFFDTIYETDPWMNSRDNPWWSGCYCVFFDNPKSEKEFDALGGVERKRLRSELVLSGRATGFLAYMDEKVMGLGLLTWTVPMIFRRRT